MAPTPTSTSQRAPEAAPLPKLHLRCLDLAHKGCDVFFAHTSPHAVLSLAASHVLRLLYPPALDAPAGPPPVRSVTLHLRAFDGVAYTCGSSLDNDHKEVHLSLGYLEGVAARAGPDASSRVKREIEGVLTHELVHAFQYDGHGSVPGGVIEGVADWVRGEAGLAPPHWTEKPGESDCWDAGYERTGFFLSFLARRMSDPLLVARLNASLRTRAWDGGAPLRALLGGRDVDALWDEYRRGVEQGGDAARPPPEAVPTHGPRKGYNVQYGRRPGEGEA